MGPIQRMLVLGLLLGCASDAADRPDRYEAVRARIREQERRCQSQSRVVPDRHPLPGEARPVLLSAYERCLERGADWIVLADPGSLRPAVFAKPDVPDPPELDASATINRCLPASTRFDKRAACIEAEGWERLRPPDDRSGEE
jgi:hypothetical protein